LPAPKIGSREYYYQEVVDKLLIDPLAGVPPQGEA